MNIHENNLGSPIGNDKLSEKERLLVGMMHQSGRFDVSAVVAQFNISRQEVYELGKKANGFLSRFPDGELFDPVLVISDKFIEISTLVLTVCCKVSYEDAIFATRFLFNRYINNDYINGLINQYGDIAGTFNNSVYLSGISDIAIDEIFKKSTPYLTGIDLDTTYVFMLEKADDRTGETWKNSLNQLKPQGFNPKISVNDAGSGMKNGLGQAFPECTPHGDVFHNLWDLGRAVFSYEQKAMSLLEDHSRMEYQVFFGKNWVTKTAAAYEKTDAIIDSTLEKADKIHILYDFAKELTNFSGYPRELTKSLLNWTLDEMLTVIDNKGPLKHPIDVFRGRIDNATSFIDQLYCKMTETASLLHTPVQVFELLYRRKTLPVGSVEYQFMSDRVLRLLHGSMELMVEMESSLDALIADTKRASSLVENLNSRIRIYLYDKRGMSNAFCNVLQLAINTKQYQRSRIKSRRRKSPLQMLNGDTRSFLDILIPDWKHYVAA